MDDSYGDLAADYEWLFDDEIAAGRAGLGATSPGSRDLLATAAGSLRPGAAVLDCACGIGADAMALARGGFAVTATDASAGMVGQARRRAAGAGIPVTVLQCRWQDLPQSAPGPFDLVVCLGNAIVHAGSQREMVTALRGMRSVLRPGGTVVVDSRNWELLHRSRPRIVPAGRVRERHGLRCASLYIWTIPDAFGPCRAEIVLLFEAADGTVTHRRHALDFRPFRHADLACAIRTAGFSIRDDSYRADGSCYVIAATAP